MIIISNTYSFSGNHADMAGSNNYQEDAMGAS
jgi:hypothetical protein